MILARIWTKINFHLPYGQQKVQTKKWQFYHLVPLLFLFSDLLTLGNILAPVVFSQAKKSHTCTYNPKCQAK